MPYILLKAEGTVVSKTSLAPGSLQGGGGARCSPGTNVLESVMAAGRDQRGTGGAPGEKTALRLGLDRRAGQNETERMTCAKAHDK